MFARLLARSLRHALVASAVVLAAAPLGAQTRFVWPAAKIDITHYTTVEECLAATARIQDSMDSPRRMRLILEPVGAADVEGMPKPVVDVAQQCSARWPAASAALDDYSPLLTLYLQAGRDDDARTLIERRLAAPGASTDSARAELLGVAMQNYVLATPVRVADAERTLGQLGTVAVTGDRVFLQMFGWYGVHTTSILLGDTARAHRAAEQLTTLATKLTPEDKTSVLWQLRARTWTYKAYEYMSWFAALDKLRQSTSAYTTIMRDNWAKASDEHQGTLRFPIGMPAAPIEGDFWFAPGATTPSPAPSPTRPTSGALSLVVFMDGCTHLSSTCWDIYATLKRLHAKYPDVEITLMGQTFGYVVDNLTVDPVKEADFYRQWWLDYQKLPGTVSVSSTPFTRVEDPDRRRMNQLTANQKNYSTGHWPSTVKGYLIDRDGTIIYADTVQRRSESHFNQLIDVLRDPHRGSGQHADQSIPARMPLAVAGSVEPMMIRRP